MSRFSALAVHEQPEVLGELVAALRSETRYVDAACSAGEAMARLASCDYQMLLVAHRPPGLDGIALLERSAIVAPDALGVLVLERSRHGGDPMSWPMSWPTPWLTPWPGPRGSPGPREGVMPQPAISAPSRPIVLGIDVQHRDRLRRLVQGCVRALRLLRDQRVLIERVGHWLQRAGAQAGFLDLALARGGVIEDPELLDAQLGAATRNALLALGEAIEAKDSYTKGHCGRVAAYTLALAQEIGYPGNELESLEIGAFLHDIGKLGIRDTVLRKPGPLDEDEWRHMREHVVMGCDLLSRLDLFEPALPAVRSHHERWDGSGYPDGLAGEEIPLIGRLVAIADAYDAMATDRSYKSALPLDECEALLRRTAGTMYDPMLIEVFVARRLGALYRMDYDDLDGDAW